jgi:hypothetical protein
MKKRGVLHVHTIFSDGEEPLEALTETFKSFGLSFAAVSDHAEVFDETQMDRYIALCDSLSNDTFLVIPGLEFALRGRGMHILAYGITRRVRFTSMEQLVDGIHEQGGLAVQAHPPAGSINMIGSIRGKLDGIEVWNARYDGIYAPRADSFQLLRRVRRQNLKASAYCGIDLHKKSQTQNLIYAELDTETLTRVSVLDSLRSGAFTTHGGSISIPSTGNLSFLQELSIAVKQPLCRSGIG